MDAETSPWYSYLYQEWLLGLIAGWLLANASEWLDRRRTKRAIRDELEANRQQIAQKQDVIGKMISALERHSFLPGVSVPSFTTIFTNHYSSVVTFYRVLERDNLHMIYGRLNRYDELLTSFEQRFKEDLSSDIVADPWDAHISQLKDLDSGYSVTSNLITKFLEHKPEDVLNREGKSPRPDAA